MLIFTSMAHIILILQEKLKPAFPEYRYHPFHHRWEIELTRSSTCALIMD